MTKYGIEISEEIIATNIKRLTNQLWKLIPMRENEENWLNQLETVIIEIVGLKEIFLLTPSFLVLLSKLEGLIYTEDFMTYRLTIFGVISLLTEITNSLDGKS